MSTEIQDSFIKIVSDAAVASSKYSGIIPSVTIAQAALESGWGRSYLAVNANNYFGIKGEYNGESVEVPSKEYINGSNVTVTSKFKKYPSIKESIEDHADLLSNSRYNEARWKVNYKDVTEALHKAGYATDPDYASKLDNIIETYNLSTFDESFIKDVNSDKDTDDSNSDHDDKETTTNSTDTTNSKDSSNTDHDDTNSTDTTSTDSTDSTKPDQVKATSGLLLVEEPTKVFSDEGLTLSTDVVFPGDYLWVEKTANNNLYALSDGINYIKSDSATFIEGGVSLESFTS